MALFAAGKLAEAQRLQTLSARMVLHLIAKYRPLPALKAMMKFVGLDCGPTRLPQVALTPAEIDVLRGDLDEMGFLAWMR
jgi:N-acetylneuraminate lyase